MRPTKISRLLAGLLAFAGAPAFAQSSKPVSPQEAPQAWVAYAETATRTIAGWLSVDAPPAPRIRAVLDAARPAPDQPAPPLVLKLWIGRDGTITRAEFPSLSDAQADQDLHALLTSKRLAPPPTGMRLPLRIALQLPAPPAPASISTAPDTVSEVP